MFMDIYIPTIDKCSVDEINELDEPSRKFFSTDGELVVLKEGFDKDVLDDFKKLLVDYMKIAPSATSRLQACDVSATFRDVKTGMKKACQLGTNTSNLRLLRNHLENSIKDFKTEFPDATIS